jgi:hypothetical protein
MGGGGGLLLFAQPDNARPAPIRQISAINVRPWRPSLL